MDMNMEMKMHNHFYSGNDVGYALFEFIDVSSGFGLFVLCVFTMVIIIMHAYVKRVINNWEIKLSQSILLSNHTAKMLTPPEIADPTLNKSLSIAMGLNRWKTYDVILKTLSKDNGTEGMEHGSGKVSKDRTSCNMRGKINKQRLKIHVVQTILHITQLIMSYVTMLLVMNYNIWLLVSVAVSGGIGYFVFASEDTGYRRLRARPPVVV